MDNRIERVNEQLVHVIALAVEEELTGDLEFFSITQAKITPDLREAKVWFTEGSTPESTKTTNTFLQKITPTIIRALKKNVPMKYIPHLTFLPDKGFRNLETIEQ